MALREAGGIFKLSLRRANSGKLGRLEDAFLDFDDMDASDAAHDIGTYRRLKDREFAFGYIRPPFERPDASVRSEYWDYSFW